MAYLKYKQAEGRHWLVPKYIVWSRRLAVDIEVILQEKSNGINVTLHFKIATYVLALHLFAVVMFVGLFMACWRLNPANISAIEWFWLVAPFVAFVISWAQFSGHVNDYLNTFKKAWSQLELEAR